MSMFARALCAAIMGILAPVIGIGQDPGAAAPGKGDVEERAVSGFILGSGDIITVRALDAEEIGDRPVRIDMAGYIRLPLLGRVRAAGLTVDQLEAELKDRLRAFVRNPDVSVGITEFHSQPVSVIGCVKNPGIHQLQGSKNLVEVLSLAGGLTTDAGYTVKITRRAEWGGIPLPGAKNDSTGKFSVAEVRLQSLLAASNPEENINVLPNDVVSVPRAAMVYVVGQVVRSGGFVLNEKESMSVLQALSLAGGLDRAASPQNSRILRSSPGVSSRAELNVDLKKILAGTSEDLALRSDDILFIPSSVPKRAAIRAMETAIQVGTGVIIWRR